MAMKKETQRVAALARQRESDVQRFLQAREAWMKREAQRFHQAGNAGDWDTLTKIYKLTEDNPELAEEIWNLVGEYSEPESE